MLHPSSRFLSSNSNHSCNIQQRFQYSNNPQKSQSHCVSCKKWSSSSNFPKRHNHQSATNIHQINSPTTTPTTHQTIQFINHGENQQINPFVINITIGDPIRERILLTTKYPTNVINNQSNVTKNVFLGKLLHSIFFIQLDKKLDKKD